MGVSAIEIDRLNKKKTYIQENGLTRELSNNNYILPQLEKKYNFLSLIGICTQGTKK